jgi:hypothetical protein
MRALGKSQRHCQYGHQAVSIGTDIVEDPQRPGGSRAKVPNDVIVKIATGESCRIKPRLG